MADEGMTIAELVELKRAAGYDAAFEALTAQRWRCPHCEHEATTLGIAINVDTLEPFCPVCDRPGIDAVQPAAPDLVVIHGGGNG